MVPRGRRFAKIIPPATFFGESMARKVRTATRAVAVLAEYDYQVFLPTPVMRVPSNLVKEKPSKGSFQL